MAKEAPRALKFDPNTEAFQMRAQWKKQDMCRKLWYKRWAWLLDERIKTQAEAEAAKKEVEAALPHVASKEETAKTLKPVPVTSTGAIGWLSSKPDCQLEIYTSWLSKPPLRLPDAWDMKNYTGPKITKH
ncbi:uncharacterized protein LOC125240750 [Leguminivora glycinivorella]|uniref:uncharacterized protein LOC125240750 n=1 Tax=Leguminivora glycinivorella TaxID=1035111 RepID=UPI00200D5B4A|nr:uncharacterized protein LOC125240750 [Leguminivora glycinivorella]XP_048004760.1 uncharacterized protein LOC125240750 [Leguminivora glycinivorella]XP_048004761.1 uncharacterized protein LOC125240750 [Leguminivora glycinivorella]XP_048004762.1 uncharacterized protein LOC125240750 [Leguminivora glycinivorella]